jgi:hypothetical protein
MDIRETPEIYGGTLRRDGRQREGLSSRPFRLYPAFGLERKMRFFIAVLVGLLGASPAISGDVAYRFTWQGANGYHMTGGMSFDPDSLSGPLVLDSDVICFEINGFKGDEHIGRWALGQLQPETTWRLHFLRSKDAFVVEGGPIQMPQAWNMNGRGDNCGAGGFGFNLGSFAQDLCKDNTLIVDSQVSPFQTLPAERDDSYAFPPDACLEPALLSLRGAVEEGA